MTAAHPEKIIILGDSIEAWMCAAFFSKLFETTDTEILLVASKKASIVTGVTSVHPSFQEFLDFIEIDQETLTKHTWVSYKLASCYSAWSSPDKTFFHTYDKYGTDKGPVRFHQAYASLAKESNVDPFDQFSASAELAKRDLSGQLPFINSTLAQAVYSWRFNTNEFTRLLMGFSRQRGLNVHQGNIKIIREPSDKDTIQSVTIENEGETYGLTADLYVNCLQHENDKAEKIDWQFEIKVNTIIRTIQKGKLKSSLCDVISSKPYGYVLLKPGQELVEAVLFSNDHVLTDDEKLHFLKQHHNPDFECSTFQPFRLRDAWKSNCISIGRQSINLPNHILSEPDLAWLALKQLIIFAPGKANCQEFTNEYNRIVGQKYDHIKDFIRLQFATLKSPRSSFWASCYEATISEALGYKLRLFQHRGKLPEYENEFFEKDYQIAFLIGMDFLPKATDPLVRSFCKDELMDHLHKIKLKIDKTLLKSSQLNKLTNE